MKQSRPGEPPRNASGRDAGPIHASTIVNQWLNEEDATFAVTVGHDGQFRFEGFSPATERLTGLATAEVVGRTPEEALPSANAAVVAARYRQCIREGAPISYLE